MAFQQELFSHSFASDGPTSQHSVKVTAVFNGKNNWFDIDYITFTDGKCVNLLVSIASSML